MTEIPSRYLTAQAVACPPGALPGDVAAHISPGLAKAALAAVVDDQLVDLTGPLDAGRPVRMSTDRSPEALPLYRHSTAHLMAAAVTQLFPGTQCGIGPAIDDGFYYDFVVTRPFVPEDLEAIEQKMKELAAQDLVYERQMWPRDEAKRFFAARGEPLKVQLIEEKTAGRGEVSCYTIKDRDTFVDFCVGPHVPSTGRLKAFKLLSTSNAYWKGTRATSRCSASTARRSSRVGSQGAPPADRGSQKARPPENRPGARALHVPRDRRRRVAALAAEGHECVGPLEDYIVEKERCRRATSTSTHQIFNKVDLWKTLGPLGPLPRKHVPAEELETEQLVLQGR